MLETKDIVIVAVLFILAALFLLKSWIIRRRDRRSDHAHKD